MSEWSVMPSAHYKDIANAIREKNSAAPAAIKSGEAPALIRAIEGGGAQQSFDHPQIARPLAPGIIGEAFAAGISDDKLDAIVAYDSTVIVASMNYGPSAISFPYYSNTTLAYQQNTPSAPSATNSDIRYTAGSHCFPPSTTKDTFGLLRYGSNPGLSSLLRHYAVYLVFPGMRFPYNGSYATIVKNKTQTLTQAAPTTLVPKYQVFILMGLASVADLYSSFENYPTVSPSMSVDFGKCVEPFSTMDLLSLHSFSHDDSGALTYGVNIGTEDEPNYLVPYVSVQIRDASNFIGSFSVTTKQYAAFVFRYWLA